MAPRRSTRASKAAPKTAAPEPEPEPAPEAAPEAAPEPESVPETENVPEAPEAAAEPEASAVEAEAPAEPAAEVPAAEEVVAPQEASEDAEMTDGSAAAPAALTNGTHKVEDTSQDAGMTDLSAPPAEEEKATAEPQEEEKEEAKVEEEAEEEEEELPEGASQVIYINNLNEKIKPSTLKQSLKVLFKQYGRVLDVTAHRSVRMRGQAFVTIDSIKAAALAVKEVKGFPLYGRPMQLAFAKTESDALVKSTHQEDVASHKKQRLEQKKIKRRDNPLRRKFLAQKAAAKSAAEATALSGVPAASTATAARRIVQMPDEYLPPNPILFVQNLPDEITKEGLEKLFAPYPNLVEVRTIPGRKNIAFVEFADEGASGVARDALHNTKFGVKEGEELKLKITFAKR